MRADDCLDAVEKSESKDIENPISGIVGELELPPPPLSLSQRLANAKLHREELRTEAFIAVPDIRSMSADQINDRVFKTRATKASQAMEDAMEDDLISEKYRVELASFLHDLDKYNNLFKSGQSARERMQLKTAKAFKILSQSIGPIAQAYAREEFAKGDPILIWKALNEKYGTDPRQEVSYLHNMLRNIKLERGEHVLTYLDKLADCMAALTERGEIFSDDFKMAALTDGIIRGYEGDKYQHFLETMRLTHRTYKEVIDELLAESLRQPAATATTVKVKQSVAYLADMSNVECYRCKGKGHYGRNCTNKLPNAARSDAAQHAKTSYPTTATTCKWCKKSGHVMDQCRSLEKVIRERGQNPGEVRTWEVKEAKLTLVDAAAASGTSKADARDLIGLDTCAGIHIVNDDKFLSRIAPGEGFKIRGFDGSAKTTTTHGQLGIIGGAVYVPEADMSLLSYSQLEKDGFQIAYDIQGAKFDVSKNEDHVGSFSLSTNGIYVSNINELNVYDEAINSSTGDTDLVAMAIDVDLLTKNDKSRAAGIKLLHDCLAHPSDDILKKMLENHAIVGCELTSHDVEVHRAIHGPCIGCLKGKMAHQIAAPTFKKSTEVGQIIHMDIMQFARQLYLIAVDDYCGFVTTVLLSDKRQATVEEAISKIINVYKSGGHKISTFRSDSEAVFISCEDFIGSMKATLYLAAPENHDHVVERAIRTIKDKTRALIYNLPFLLPVWTWRFGIEYAVLGINSVPNTNTGVRSPTEFVTGKKLIYDQDIRASFGTIIEARLPYAEADATAPRSETGVVVGRLPRSKGILKVFMVSIAELTRSTRTRSRCYRPSL